MQVKVDRLMTMWQCGKCQKISKVPLGDLATVGTPMCTDDDVEMELMGNAVITLASPATKISEVVEYLLIAKDVYGDIRCVTNDPDDGISPITPMKIALRPDGTVADEAEENNPGMTPALLL